MPDATNFGLLDWLLVAAFLVASTVAGLWSRRYVRGADSFLIADRRVRGYLGVASIIATEMGLVTVMYSAQKGFTGGFAAFHIALAAAVVALFVGLTGFIVVPLRRAGVMTIPEFYERRFGRGARVLGGTILALSGILNMGMFLKADSLFITHLTGLHSPAALNVAMSGLLGLVLLYTVLGGMMSVLVTDYLQFVIMAVSLVIVSLVLMARFGWGELTHTVADLMGPAGFDPFANGEFGPAYVIWMLFLGLVSCALWQTAVIRASSAADLAAVRQTFTWGSVGFLIRFMIPYFWGICALVYVAGKPELRAVFLPADGRQPSSETTLSAMPVAFGQLLPTGMLGVLMAGMLAAAMSTYNTYLHSWSLVLTQDVIGPLYGDRLSPRGRVVLTQGLMVLLGLFLLVWGLWYPLGEQLWDYMAVTGAVYFTGAFAVLVGGLYWRRASRTGAYAAFACGVVPLAGLKPVQELLHVDWRSEYVGLAAVVLAAGALAGGSLLRPDRPKKEK